MEHLTHSYPLDPETFGYTQLSVALHNLKNLKRRLEAAQVDAHTKKEIELLNLPLKCLQQAQQQLSTLMTRENLQ